MMITTKLSTYFLLASLVIHSSLGLVLNQRAQKSRRAFLSKSTATLITTVTATPYAASAAASTPALNFQDSKSGIQWADAKVGTGPYLKTGSTASIDYVLSTTGARYGSSIYKTAEKGAPYSK